MLPPPETWIEVHNFPYTVGAVFLAGASVVSCVFCCMIRRFQRAERRIESLEAYRYQQQQGSRRSFYPIEQRQPTAPPTPQYSSIV